MEQTNSLQKMQFWKKSPAELENRNKELKGELDNIRQTIGGEERLQKALEAYLKRDINPKNHGAFSQVLGLVEAFWKVHGNYRNTRADIDKLERSRSDLRISLDKALTRNRDIESEYSERLTELDNTVQNQVAEKSRLENQIGRLRSELRERDTNHSFQIDSVKIECRNQIENLNFKHGLKISEMEDKWREEKKTLEISHSEALGMKDRVANAEKVRLEKAIADQEAKMRKDIENLTGALLARGDAVVTKTDAELKDAFLELARDIERVARVDWEFNRTEWGDDIIASFRNQRRLKKQVLQDQFWAILYETVFCSPFRVLGEEGKLLEAQWKADFGETENGLQTEGRFFMWPDPNIRVERWRYETVKNCQEALTIKISEWDTRMELKLRLKRSFQSYLDGITQRLIDALGKVCSVNETTAQALKSISEKAANMWLGMGAQLCRILVVIPESCMQPGSRLLDTKGVIELVLQAELQRFGNSSGKDLEKKEIIGGCEAKIETVTLAR